MSPLAKLLQIKPAPERQKANLGPALGRIWKRFIELLRSARVQRKVRRLEIVERVAVGNKQSVLLLRVDQKEFVVGCSGDQVVLLVAPPTGQSEAQSNSQSATQTKAQTKARPKAERQRRRVRPMQAQPAVVVVQPPASPEPVQQTAPIATAARTQTKIRKPSSQIELPLKRRVPSKAKLVKAFAARSK